MWSQALAKRSAPSRRVDASAYATGLIGPPLPLSQEKKRPEASAFGRFFFGSSAPIGILPALAEKNDSGRAADVGGLHALAVRVLAALLGTGWFVVSWPGDP